MPTFIENTRSFVLGAPSDGEIYEAFHCYLHAFMQYGTCNASSCACVQGSCPHRGISTLVLFISAEILILKKNSNLTPKCTTCIATDTEKGDITSVVSCCCIWRSRAAKVLDRHMGTGRWGCVFDNQHGTFMRATLISLRGASALTTLRNPDKHGDEQEDHATHDYECCCQLIGRKRCKNVWV